MRRHTEGSFGPGALDRRRDLGIHEAASAVVLPQRVRNRLSPRHLEGRAVCRGDRLAQIVVRQSPVTVEHHPLDDGTRHEVVAEGDPLGAPRRAQLDIAVSPESKEVGQTLADVPHLQRLRNAGLDEFKHRWVAKTPSLGNHHDLVYDLSDVWCGVLGPHGIGLRQQGTDHERQDRPSHQKACRTRKSRA